MPEKFDCQESSTKIASRVLTFRCSRSDYPGKNELLQGQSACIIRQSYPSMKMVVWFLQGWPGELAHLHTFPPPRNASVQHRNSNLAHCDTVGLRHVYLRKVFGGYLAFRVQPSRLRRVVPYSCKVLPDCYWLSGSVASLQWRGRRKMV